MITLGLDTSEARGGIAIWRENRLVGEAMMAEPFHHAEELLLLVEQLLEGCYLNRNQIDLISVNRGPGSFTGLRIGIATAKGICQALEIPLVGVDGTVSYRARFSSEKRICVIIPARRDLYYVQWFIGTKAANPIEVISEENLLQEISQQRKAISVVGSGVERLRERLDPIPATVWFAPEEMNQPAAVWIAQLGATYYTSNTLYDLEPAYVEPVTARTNV
jgi:tRNA threonylcarbamoyladenosine biosynthesis protein TsaB